MLTCWLIAMAHRVAIEDGHHDTGEVGVCGTYKKPQRDDSEKFRRFHASHEKSLVVVKTPVHEQCQFPLAGFEVGRLVWNCRR